MAALEISVDGEPLENVVNNHDGTYSVVIDEDLRGRLTVYAADKAQREGRLCMRNLQWSWTVLTPMSPQPTPLQASVEHNGVIYRVPGLPHRVPCYG